MDLCFIDIETYSGTGLEGGVYRYAADPSFQIILAAWSTDGVTVHMAHTQEEILAIPGLTDPRVLKVAHNAAFERICFSRALGLPVGEYLPPEEWEDTMAIAAERGLPQGLGLLARALGAEDKDAAGTRLINMFCKPNKHGHQPTPADHPLEWLDFIDYCEQDVYTLIDVYHRLEKLGGWPTEMEKKIFLADQRINDRGIAIDVQLAKLAKHQDELNTVAAKARVVELTGGAVQNVGSVPQMLGWLQGQGLPAEDVRAGTLDNLLSRDDLTPVQREVLEIRKETALAASKKFGAALNSVLPDGRVRGSFRFFGAHTGRWSGRGTQLQNLPRDAFKTELEAEEAILDLKLGESLPTSHLKKLVRPLFMGPFTVVDYAAIEARVVAWLAGETWALRAFEEGRDIYVETAQRMGGLSRTQGKVAVLALGYNGGANSLRAMSGEGFYRDPRTGKIIDAGSLGAAKEEGLFEELTDDELREHFVYPWREANSRIVKLWESLGQAFGDGGKAGPKLEMHHWTEGKKTHAMLELPSGRAITYRAIHQKTLDKKDPVTGEVKKRKTWAYLPGSGGWMSTYGGRLTENATQAVARDIMAEALVRLEDAGYRVVGHVHDEVIIEGLHDVEEIKEIMCQLPAWASGLPIDGAGFTCQRYRKG